MPREKKEAVFHGVLTNMINCNCLNYGHFRTNTLKKSMNTLIPSQQYVTVDHYYLSAILVLALNNPQTQILVCH